MLVDELAAFLVQEQLQGLRVLKRLAALDESTSLALAEGRGCKWVPCDHKVLERGYLHHRVEKLVLCWHLVEGKVQLLEIREHLLLWRCPLVVLWQIPVVEFDELVARQVQLPQIGDGADCPYQCIGVDESRVGGEVVGAEVQFLETMQAAQVRR